MTIALVPIHRSLLLALMGMVGCGSRGAGPETFPVTGEVTLDGQAVAGADVTFLPSVTETDAAPAQAVTDESGRFEVISIFDQGRISQAGMRPGDYEVEVTQLEQAPAGASLSRKPRNLLPDRYSSTSSSGLRVKVAPESENHFPLKLTK